ncbi:hypothetical protein [Domibacillus tundrae]|uniref:hypothetical protein n=1 Tax=Domibacillus tundrae TaxID=1587527 RepID=UPI000617DE1C|nr:hypothetical protein [Domibacillus tundrae]
MAVLSFMTKSYAQNVYIYGNRKFEGGVPLEYHQPVKEYAAVTYSDLQIDASLANQYVTQPEYEETMAIKHPPEETAEVTENPATEPTNETVIENGTETAPAE